MTNMKKLRFFILTALLMLWSLFEIAYLVLSKDKIPTKVALALFREWEKFLVE